MKTDLQLAATRLGRIVLHLRALNRDWRFRWHLAGIIREFQFSHSALRTPHS